jgi:Mg2+ and Co2+ transporter CorA
VVWGILDAVVDDLQPVVEEIENDIEAVEHTIFAELADATERIYELKQQVNRSSAPHPRGRDRAARPAQQRPSRRMPR